MKKITINGYDLSYQTIWEGGGEYEGNYPITYFYLGEEEITYKKYWLFGPEIKEKRPKKIFQIWADTDNLRLSKTWWREQILKEIELLERNTEIAAGELI